MSRWITFVALTNVNMPNRLISKECGDDWVWGYHSPGPRHYRPVEPQPSIPLSQEGRETKQSTGMIHLVEASRTTLKSS